MGKYRIREQRPGFRTSDWWIGIGLRPGDYAIMMNIPNPGWDDPMFTRQFNIWMSGGRREKAEMLAQVCICCGFRVLYSFFIYSFLLDACAVSSG